MYDADTLPSVACDAFDKTYYLSKNPDVLIAGVDPLCHFVEFGWREGRDPNPFFSTRSYLLINQDIDLSNESPLEHYNRVGRRERRDTDITKFLINAIQHSAPPMNADLSRRKSYYISKSKLFHFLAKNTELFAKALQGKYLAKTLSDLNRIQYLAHHYLILINNLTPEGLFTILNEKITLWTLLIDDSRFEINIHYSRIHSAEGDLTITLNLNQVEIYFLSFLIIPSKTADNSEDMSSIFIGRMQGKGGCFDNIRVSTKALHDIAPPYLLLAALQGIARALHISKFVGVPAHEHPAYKDMLRHTFVGSYDSFFTSIGGEVQPDGFYHINLPLSEKPLRELRQDRRARAQKKRRFKAQLAQQAFEAMQHCLV